MASDPQPPRPPNPAADSGGLETLPAAATPPAEPTPADATLPAAPAARAGGSRPQSPAPTWRYRIDGEIGRGGMGAVFRAFDLDLQREVALKVLHLDLAADPSLGARFVEEAQVAARLQHPAIVPVYDVGSMPDGKLYFTMQLVAGRTLSDVVAGARRGDADARDYTTFRLLEAFREICRAISYVHEHGIVHRDLKPHNVMLGSYGEVQVMDWGVAKVLRVTPQKSEAPKNDEAPSSSGASSEKAGALSSISSGRWSASLERNATVAGDILGTPAYMAPEQARGSPEVSPLWDVYALGAILHYILTGQPPVTGATPSQMIAQLLDDSAPRPRPRSRDSSIAAEAEAICLRALARRPEERYPTAKALADDVQAFLEQRPVSAFPEGRLRRAYKWARRRRRGLAVGTLASFVALGAAMTVRAVTARAARGTLVHHAAERAAAASARFFTARSVQPSPGAASVRRDDLLGLGIDALETAQGLVALAPDDGAARRQAFDVALALGEVALEDEQWSLSASVFGRARELGLDDTRAQQAVDSVARARTRVADEHAAMVARILDEARSGRMANRGSAHEDALFELVGLREPATVKALAAELDALIPELRAQHRATLLSAQVLTAEETARGERPIAGLEVAVDTLLALQPGQQPDHATEQTVKLAIDRMCARYAREHNWPKSAPAPSFHTIVGAAQEARVGRGPLQAARLASEALGRIGIADGAVDALSRYLQAEQDELRAVPPAVALCLLGRPSSEAVIVAGRRRFSSNGLYWKEISRFLARLHASSGAEPTTVADYILRARLRITKHDLDGALADATRAIELDPKSQQAFIESGIAHRVGGDLDEAIADYGRAIALGRDNPVPWNDRGFAELEKGQLDAAIADLSHAISLHPKTPRSRTHRATAYRLQGKLSLAIAEFSASLKTDDRFTLAWRGRGDARLDAGDTVGALEDYQRALELDGRDAATWASLARARLKRGDLTHAFEAASRAVELDPRSGPAWWASGDVRAARGDKAGAITDLEKALTVDLPERDRAALRARLGSLGKP
jgi:serine/threonine protein kinase/Flp pilus assembly protein TadD